MQAQINERQQFINQSVQLGQVNGALIRALAQVSVANKDDKLRDLLAQVGFTITAPASVEPSPAPDNKKSR